MRNRIELNGRGRVARQPIAGQGVLGARLSHFERTLTDAGDLVVFEKREGERSFEHDACVEEGHPGQEARWARHGQLAVGRGGHRGSPDEVAPWFGCRNLHDGPGARPRRASSVARGTASASAQATYQAS